MKNSIDIRGKIQELSQLNDGWDFGEGYAPDKSTIENACYIFSFFEKPEYEYTINPTSNGGVRITAKIGADFLDLTVNRDLTIDLTHEHGFGSLYETVYHDDKVSMEAIKTYLNSLSIQSCFSSERYTLKNSTTSKVDLTATVLQI